MLADFQQFVPVEAPVQGCVDGAELAAGEKYIQVFVTVACQDRHPVAFANPLAFEPVCQAVGPLVGLAEGQAPFGRFACIDEGQLIRRVEFTPC